MTSLHKLEEKTQTRILYSEKIYFRNQDKMTFADKQKLREFISSRSSLQEKLKFFGEKQYGIRHKFGSTQIFEND